MSVNVLALWSRNIGNSKNNALCFAKRKLSPLKLGYISSASITSKANRDPNYKRKPPFPYKEKKYTMFRSWFDRTTDRFDENSKIIVVDGPIAVGKGEFAKQLAEDLDMLYMPGANMDMWYINSYGFDERTLNPQLAASMQKTDEASFCRDPFQLNTAYFQISMFQLRMSIYMDALAHLMNTGQGVVLVRSMYSDMVFAEAMQKENYIRRQVLKGYYTLRNEIFPEFLQPHLQIYLDIPVPVVQEKIKARGRDWEINGKALTTSYLQALEDNYKKKFLPDIEKHAELLIYDWTEPGDMEMVVEDVEAIDFERYTVYDKKMCDWRFPKEQALSDFRMKFTDDRQYIFAMFNYPLFDCPELYAPAEEAEEHDALLDSAPGNKYAKGYNLDCGDTGFLFKTKTEKL
ncbi:NADH dehydrogenase (ubiquinone) subunit ND-42 [Lycorma delicatula]|uniref:NADH dehydrogenase (ubiquinone) subunit ND-42 n=1 Tax=Lycorma delicatula TaxID=130591 RepID=UPI003F515F88